LTLNPDRPERRTEREEFMHDAIRKPYEPPTLRKPTWNQATLFLTGHAYLGDPGANKLLELLFPEPTMPNASEQIRDNRDRTSTATQRGDER
jgi:hypothetical protein